MDLSSSFKVLVQRTTENLKNRQTFSRTIWSKYSWIFSNYKDYNSQIFFLPQKEILKVCHVLKCWILWGRTVPWGGRLCLEKQGANPNPNTMTMFTFDLGSTFKTLIFAQHTALMIKIISEQKDDINKEIFQFRSKSWCIFNEHYIKKFV